MEDTALDLLATHPHDAFIRDVLSDPTMATAFFKEHLPPAITSMLDWSSLRLEPGSFITQSLHQAHSDLLFSIQAAGSQCFLYLLFEHQTTVDKLMPLRLLNYTLEIMRGHVEIQGLPLPPVLPIVLHQGPDRWTVSTCFEDLFALPPALANTLLPYLPKFRHALLDLSQFDPLQEGADQKLKSVLLLAKYAHEKRLNEFMDWLLHAEIPPKELLRKLLLYFLHGDSDIDVKEFARKLDNNHPLKEEIMSAAATIKAEGRAEGKAEGEARGAAIGRLTVLQEIMRLPVSSKEELAELDLVELESRYHEMQRRYDAQFKGV